LSLSVSGQAGEFAIENDSCTGAVVAAQGTCAFSVAVKPTGVGARSANVVVVNPGTSAQVMTALAGTGLSCASLTITPTSYSFGTVNVGDSSFGHQFTITNTSGASTGTLTTATGGPNVGDFLKMADNCNGQALAPGAGCTLFVTFEPGAAGSRSGRVTAAASPGGTASADLSGTGQ
ncbi:MAG: choice-of-anchor D domain-containing protein, partial [Polyangiales bacterium]